MPGFSIHDVIRTEEQFREMQDILREMGQGDRRLCRISFAEFLEMRSVAEVLTDPRMSPPPRH